MGIFPFFDWWLFSPSTNYKAIGQWCGSVGRAVASNTRGPRFESRHRQIFIEHLFTVNYIVVYENKRKLGREWPIFFCKKQ